MANDNSFWRRLSEGLDGPISVLSPRLARNRQAYRFAYDALDQTRLRKKRKKSEGLELTESTLDELRQIARDLSSNNPLIKGLFRKLATNIVGTSTRIQARTADSGWNSDAEQAFKEEMIDRPCDITGRLNFHTLLLKSYYRYAQDGDEFTILNSEGPQALQGECCGTPFGKSVEINPEYFDVINGVAFSKQSGKLLGYYIGKPNKWGYIQPGSYRKYLAEQVHHMVNFERFDHSRGEPMLTSAVVIIDQLFGYIDAELVAAKINACFPIIAKTKTGNAFVGASGNLRTEKGEDIKDPYDRPLVRMEPGQIWEGEIDEGLEAVGAARPPQAFDPFVMRMLMFVGAPACLPLMLTTGDFSHATFMNMRFGLNEARSFWHDEQEIVVRPLVDKLWAWKIRQLIERKELTDRKDWSAHQAYLKRWPYVDPYREAQADDMRIQNATGTHRDITARDEGRDWQEEIWPQWLKEQKMIKDSGFGPPPKKNGGPE